MSHRFNALEILTTKLEKLSRPAGATELAAFDLALQSAVLLALHSKDSYALAKAAQENLSEATALERGAQARADELVKFRAALQTAKGILGDEHSAIAILTTMERVAAARGEGKAWADIPEAASIETRYYQPWWKLW